MKLQKILRSNLGFSMVEISVAMGLLGLASLAVMNLSDQVNTSTRTAEMMLSKSQFASALGGYLYSAKACNEMKGMSGFSTTPKEIVLDDWEVAGIGATQAEMMKGIGAGKKFKNFELRSLRAVMEMGGSLPIVNIAQPNGAPSIPHTKTFLNVTAVLAVAHKGPKTPEADKRTYEYFFNIPVLAKAGGVIGACSEEKSIQETCASMKGIYDEATKQCNLERTCMLQGAYQEKYCSHGSPQVCNSSGGATTNNPYTTAPSCPSGSQRIQTGTKTWSHLGTCSGKKCDPPTLTATLAYYSCLKCPPPGGTTSSGSGFTSGSGSTSGSTTGSYTGSGGGGCFVAGTQIHLYGGETKNIEDVKVGDLLVDHKGSPAEVQTLITYSHQGEVYSINGGPYFFTPNHPFLSTDGWKSLDPAKTMQESPELKVSKLKVGDILLKRNGHEVVKTLDARPSNEKVYNFTLNNSHEYIADDYAVHNKQAPLEPNNGFQQMQ